MCLQESVELQHYIRRCNTILFSSRNLVTSKLHAAITKMFDRIRVVLYNMLESEGGNELVEKKCGIQFKYIKIEKVITELRNYEIFEEINLQ